MHIVEYIEGDVEIPQFCIKVKVNGPTGGKMTIKFYDSEGLIVPPHMKDKVSHNPNPPDEKCFDDVESLNGFEYKVTLVERGMYIITHIIDYDGKEIDDTNNAFVERIKVH